VNTQANKQMLAIAVGGENGYLVENFLVTLSQKAIGEQYSLKLVEYRYADQLLEAARRQTFDLFIVFLNPTLTYSVTRDTVEPVSDFEILRHLKLIYQKPLFVMHNGFAGYSADAIKQAGADAVFGMPFDYKEFAEILRSCLHRPPGERW
jgi:hypothetical protein